MAFLSGLDKASIAQVHGIIAGVGVKANANNALSAYFRWSNDEGETAAPIGAETEVEIATTPDEQPAIAVLHTAEIVVVIGDGAGNSRVFCSDNFGRTWNEGVVLP